MTHVRTIAAVATAALTLVLAPQVSSTPTATAAAATEPIVVAAPVEALPEVDAIEVIDGVRIVADSEERIALATRSVEKFVAAGWVIDNTEIRWDDDCVGAVGYHAEERGHHVVVMCNDQEWTLLHELGHVWSDLYLDDDARAEWVSRRELDSWHEGEYDDRGTEQAAQVIAFGLFDTAHVPSMSNNDYRTMIEDFEWLFGTDPLHRQANDATSSSTVTDTRIEVVASRDIAPVGAPATELLVEAPAAPAEFRFPMACGYPRWNSSNGGFGYVDPRDWTHVGVDLYAFEGTPVVSPAHGVVTDAGWGDVSGWRVVVTDRFGTDYVMVHLSSPPVVSAGMEVTAGQTIGKVGRSGNASGGGPHLHFEIRIDGEPIDPMPWIRTTDGGNVERAPGSFYTTVAPSHSDCRARS